MKRVFISVDFPMPVSPRKEKSSAHWSMNVSQVLQRTFNYRAKLNYNVKGYYRLPVDRHIIVTKVTVLLKASHA